MATLLAASDAATFAEKNIAGIESEVLVLGSIDQDNKVILLQPDIVVKNGSPVA